MTHAHRPLLDLHRPYRSQGTVCYVLDADRILLGWKQRGPGTGLANGFGGKIEPGESARDAARRELLEEAGLHADRLYPAGHVLFNHADILMHVFVATEWQGAPQPSDEMQPQWFALDAIPYSRMWVTDVDWLPLVLAGSTVDVVVTKHADESRTSDVMATGRWR